MIKAPAENLNIDFFFPPEHLGTKLKKIFLTYGKFCSIKFPKTPYLKKRLQILELSKDSRATGL